MKLLFIVKNREFPYSLDQGLECYSTPFSSGLYNSVSFVNRMLQEHGFDSNLESAIDNNCIDRLITLHNPTHVILEALWVVPSKVEALQKLHPSVKWIVRLHSEVPFIAVEGIFSEWIFDYNRLGVEVTANSPRMVEALEIKLQKEIGYTPNYYFMTKNERSKYSYDLDIGCFGAIRTLKNHLIQALAAIKYADRHQLKLNFHVNSSRIEGEGSPVLKNLRGLFDNINHNLIEHDWLDHIQFKELVGSMDAVMQCSFTETYNVVAADAVSMNIPIVSSKEIKFINRIFAADPTDVNAICKKLENALIGDEFNLQILNRWHLSCNNRNAIKAWKRYLNHLSY